MKRFILWIHFVVIQSKIISPIYLNTTNERFQQRDGYLQINVNHGDKFDIICPKVDTFLETLNSTEPLFLSLWNVNRRGFNSCVTDKGTSKRLLRCNVPNWDKKYTIRVQNVSALPDVMLFDQGQTYYFIVPTKGEDISDIESTTGGLCKTNNLRLLIHVQKEVRKPPPTTSTTTILSTSLLRQSLEQKSTNPSKSAEKSAEQMTDDGDGINQSEFNQVEMWFGIVIGASIVMIVVLCALCIIKIVHKKHVQSKEIPPQEPFDIMTDYINAQNYQSFTLMKNGSREILTMGRSYDKAKVLHESSTMIVSDPTTQNSTMSETNSLLDENYTKPGEIKLTKEGFVVQV